MEDLFETSFIFFGSWTITVSPVPELDVVYYDAVPTGPLAELIAILLGHICKLIACVIENI